MATNLHKFKGTVTMQEQLKTLVRFLSKRAGEDDMASVIINSDGMVILRVGVSYEQIMSIDDFAAEINDK